MRWVRISELGPTPKVVLVDRWHDETIWWVIEDSEGKQAVVCLDGHKGSPTQNRLLEGTRHSQRPGGRVLELGAPEEGIAVPLLSQWLDAQMPPRGVAEEYFIEVIQKALLRLGEPVEPEPETGD